MKETNLKYIAYSRKSTDREDRQVLSIESQSRELKKTAEKDNLPIKCFLSESKTAYKIGREKFSEMIELIKAGKANAILTWHLTRLARNSKDGGEIIYLMDEGLLKEIRTPDGIFTNTTNDKFLMQIHFAMSKKSSDDTSDFVKRDIETKLAKGEYPGRTPLGYLNIDTEGRIAGKRYTFEKQELLALLNRKLKRVEKDPLLSDKVIKIFEEASKGSYSLKELVEISYKLGLTGAERNNKLRKEVLRSILMNPFYYGAIRFNKKIIEPEELPEETKHDPLISRELFNKVQEELKNKSRPKNSHRYYSYSCYIKCPSCGGRISGLVVKGITYYRCAKCTNLPYINETNLESQISNIAEDISVKDIFLKLAVEEINKENDKEVKKRDSIKKNEEIALTKCQKKMDNLIKLKISPENSDGSLLSDEEFLSQKKEIMCEKSLIKERLEDNDNRTQNWYDNVINYMNFAHNLAKKFKKATPQKKKEAFQFICYNPVLNNKILQVSYEKETDKLIQFKNKHRATITAGKPMNISKNRAYDPVFTDWLRTVNNVRTIFERQNEYVYIPDLRSYANA